MTPSGRGKGSTKEREAAPALWSEATQFFVGGSACSSEDSVLAVLWSVPAFPQEGSPLFCVFPLSTLETSELANQQIATPDKRVQQGLRGLGPKSRAFRIVTGRRHERADPACVPMVSWPLMAFPSVLCTLHGAMKEGGLLLIGRSAVVSSSLRAASPGSWSIFPGSRWWGGSRSYHSRAPILSVNTVAQTTTIILTRISFKY